MFAEKRFPEIIHPAELDHYLAQGWYRMGHTIFTTHFLTFHRHFYSTIWIRLPLQGYTFSKRLRKLMRRNERKYFHQVVPINLTDEKEALYQIYRASFPGSLASTLQKALRDGSEKTIFNTYEVNIYDRETGKLVAYSFFDLGRYASASILGVYHPDHKADSLGFYTMLCEIQHSLSLNMRYFYPGYVVPGHARFDYKLRIGEVQFFKLKDRTWQPYTEFTISETPLEVMRRQLLQLQVKLLEMGIPSRPLYYPLFEANLLGFWRAAYLDYPLFLWLHPTEEQGGRSGYLMIVYDVERDCYLLIRCLAFEDFQFYFKNRFLAQYNSMRHFKELVIVDRELAQAATAEDMARCLLDMGI